MGAKFNMLTSWPEGFDPDQELSRGIDEDDISEVIEEVAAASKSMAPFTRTPSAVKPSPTSAAAQAKPAQTNDVQEDSSEDSDASAPAESPEPSAPSSETDDTTETAPPAELRSEEEGMPTAEMDAFERPDATEPEQQSLSEKLAEQELRDKTNSVKEKLAKLGTPKLSINARTPGRNINKTIPLDDDDILLDAVKSPPPPDLPPNEEEQEDKEAEE